MALVKSGLKSDLQNRWANRRWLLCALLAGGCADWDALSSGLGHDLGGADLTVAPTVDLATGDGAANGCSDGVRDGDETDRDCGGTCSPCGDGKKCAGDGDCKSGRCANQICVAARCSDFHKDGDETDVDCGGASCPRCVNGRACQSGGDCLSANCDGGVCKRPANPRTLGFGAPKLHPVGGVSPTALVAVDLDGDGKLDVAVLNLGMAAMNSSVSPLLGKGDGTFGDAATFPAGNVPHGFDVADFDSDGKINLAVGSSFDNAVDLFVGNGKGGFAAGATFSCNGTTPTGIATTDFDGDGHADLAAADEGSGTVSTLLGDGKGAFPRTKMAASGSMPFAIAVADLNRDGKADLAVAYASGMAGVHLGNGDGSLGMSTTFNFAARPTAIAAGDLDRDGDADLVVALIDGRVAILLGDGGGGFAAPVFYQSGLTQIASLALADLDGDGNLDAAVAQTTGANAAVLLGAGDGTLGTGQIIVVGGAEHAAILAANLNGDRLPDLILSSDMANTVAAVLNGSH